jgi:hypothetical protein
MFHGEEENQDQIMADTMYGRNQARTTNTSTVSLTCKKRDRAIRWFPKYGHPLLFVLGFSFKFDQIPL